MKNTSDFKYLFKIFSFAQFNFGKEMVKKIFGDDWEHYWDKWTSCDHNLIDFINRLDDSNKDKFFLYLNKLSE
jgi:hypothetical protein